MNGSWNPKGSSSCVAETGSLQAQELSKSRRNRSGLPHSKELAWCTNPWARSLEGSGWGSPSGGLGAGPEQGQCLGDEPRGGWETRAVLEEAQGKGGWGGGALEGGSCGHHPESPWKKRRDEMTLLQRVWASWEPCLPAPAPLLRILCF